MIKEKSYIINLEEAVYLENLLSKILKRDRYSQDKPYVVRSLYFDSIRDGEYFAAVHDEESGYNPRVKTYNNDKYNIKFEMKKKYHDICQKETLCIQQKDVYELIRGNFTSLLNSENACVQSAYILMNTQCYRPKTIVEYDRVVYVSDTSSIKVSFDYNIRMTESCLDLFKEDLILYNSMPREKVILEIKYQNFIPTYLLDLFSRLDMQESTISKYRLGRCLGYSQIYK